MECFACIHCHFYQPPRENPWLEAVESQDSAAPYHDWNERIARECYLPNGASRILDSDWRIRQIVNNYARISFNFGPTLLSWMEDRAPEAYQRILDGDRESQRLRGGHGGAIAQAYNHTILPLATFRDKRTQILWGIHDFERRFERHPEGMWLPETAVDIETLELLSAEGIQFTILAPRQAAEVRANPRLPWANLDYGIDSRRAYACSLPSGRNIGLFFYDGALATAVAFEGLLYNGENFARRLLSRFNPEGDSAQLMHVATDGESYGHHHPHGDMALAYALEYIERNHLARLTNYGEYFHLHPPEQEVRIHQRSSWSCMHGVARWEANCGCNSGGHREWNQEWRRPLRAAFDWLRDELSRSFEREGKKLFLSPWLARDEYIRVVADRSSSNVTAFLKRHSLRALSPEDEVRCLRMLELQRHLMLMYTSCGWFFDEVSGPETVQVLQYAARAVQLGQQLFGGDPEQEFLKRLQAVDSNLAEFGNGREIYERFVRPAMLDLPGVAAHYAISSFFEGYRQSDSIYSYHADLGDLRMIENGRLKLASGAVRITSRITHAQFAFNFAVLHAGGHTLRAGVSEAGSGFSKFVTAASGCLSRGEFNAAAKLLEHYFGSDVYSLKSLFHDERGRIVRKLVDSSLADVDKLYGEVYEHNTALIGFLRELGMPLPSILRVSSEFVLSNEIRRALSADEMRLDRVSELLDTAHRCAIDIDACVQPAFHDRLHQMMERWARSPLSIETITPLQPLVALMRLPALEPDLWTAQNIFYERSQAVSSLSRSALPAEWLREFRKLGEALGIADLPTIPAAPPQTECRHEVDSPTSACSMAAAAPLLL
jgi:alpha-amylase/alpha-mannosidase (GH57 family)